MHLSMIGYFEGIAENLELMPTYYPGWIMRVYYDLEDDDPITQVIDLFRHGSDQDRLIDFAMSKNEC